MKLDNYGLWLDQEELEYFITIEKKFIRPHLRKVEWDGLTVKIGKSKKHTFAVESDFRSFFYRLWDSGVYIFREPPAKREKKTSGLCSFYGCQERGTHPHHITYRPPCVKKLCPQHHRDITAVNINESDRVGRLSNAHRWWAWGQWLKGELKPRYTPNVERWLRSWKD
jgi:hypothetical protein